MDEALSLHVIAPAGGGRERLTSGLAGLDAVVHDTVEDFREAAGQERCAVLAGGGVDAHELLDLCREVADRDREWLVLLAEGGTGSLILRPLSVGFPVAGSEVGSLLEGEGAPPFELHEVLRYVARLRHDVNNPLTAGLAETQLLLMDLGGEGEVGESLQTIERQLQRIRGLVQDLAELRRPSPDAS